MGQVWKVLHACKTKQINIKRCSRGCHNYSFLHKPLAKTFCIELDKIYDNFFTYKTLKDLSS